MSTIPIGILLKPTSRNRPAAEQVAQLARDRGWAVTSIGAATVSARVSPEQFRRDFGVEPQPLAPRPPGGRDFGRPGGYAAPEPLPTPSELEPYVESIAITPPATRLGP